MNSIQSAVGVALSAALLSLVAAHPCAAEDGTTVALAGDLTHLANAPVSVARDWPPHVVERARQGVVVRLGSGVRVVGQWAPPSLLDEHGHASSGAVVAGDVTFILPPEAAKDYSARDALPVEFVLGPNDYAPGFHWQGDDLMLGDAPALRYVHPVLDESSPEAREQTYKPFHHLFSPDGTKLVTKGPGGLYTHHRGLFFAFNRISYGDDRHCDVWHCKGKAFQGHEAVLAEEAGPVFGRQRVRIGWHGQEGEVFAAETRELTIYKTAGGRLVEFASRVETADGTVHLDGDPQHAGFHFRADNEVADTTEKQTYYLRPAAYGGQDEPGATKNWPDVAEHVNLPWNAMSFVLGDHRYTALYLDRPENPKEARFSERSYGRFGSYFEYDVTPEEPLEVNYRLWLQDGELTSEQAEQASAAFTAAVETTGGEAESDWDDAPEGFTALFNGKNLDGWKGLVASPPQRAAMSAEELAAAQEKADERMREHWSVVDGVLVFDGGGDSLCTIDDYADFEFYVDWKIEPKGDSGIYLRGSPQVQIWDDPIGSGGLYNNQKNPSQPTAVADRPVGEWNRFFIRMVGDKVTVYLNGQLVVDDVVMENYWERDKPIYPSGQIELQNHGNTLYFDNVYVRRLD